MRLFFCKQINHSGAVIYAAFVEAEVKARGEAEQAGELEFDIIVVVEVISAHNLVTKQ